MLDLTAFVLTQNNQRTIKACLESIVWCDEIVMIDSYSTDSTLEIARSYPNVKIYQHQYTNAMEQRIWGMPHVKTKWTLIVDSDNICPPVLRDKIIEIMKSKDNAYDGYLFLSRTMLFGKLLKHKDCISSMGKKLVLTRIATRYHKKVRVHASIRLDNPKRMPYEYYMIHDPVDNLPDHFRKMVRYANWQAQDMYDKGRKPKWWNYTLQPLWKFLRFYLFAGGVRDGFRGLLVCCLGAISVATKYIILVDICYKKNRL